MTTNRQFGDSEGDFADWKDHPQPCNRNWTRPDGKSELCGAPVQVRTWESHCGGYEDYQYRCTGGHTWWIDGDDG